MSTTTGDDTSIRYIQTKNGAVVHIKWLAPWPPSLHLTHRFIPTPSHSVRQSPNQAKASASTPVPSSHQPHCGGTACLVLLLALSPPLRLPKSLRGRRGDLIQAVALNAQKSRDKLLVTPTLNGFAVWPARVSAFVAFPEVKRSKLRSCMVEARDASIQTHVGGC